MKNISLNFGAIKESVMRLSSSEVLKEGESKTLNNFSKEIKSSPTLRKQYFIFNNFEKVKPFKETRLAERFIAQNLKLLEGVSWQDILKENKKIRLELLSNSHVESFNNGKLFDDVQNLIEAKINSNFTNFEKEQESYERVVKHLTREIIKEGEELSNEKSEYPDLLSLNVITKLAFNKFNERFSHLNESEKKILSILISDKEKKINYLEDLKEELCNKINNLLELNILDESRKEILNTFKDKINNLKEIKEENLDNSILSCIELKENLEDLI